MNDVGLEAIENFVDAYWSGEVDAALAACPEDFVWLNTALPKQRLEGHDALATLMTSCEWFLLLA